MSSSTATARVRKPCFVIAEAGVNHNGDLGLARDLILAAREAGADAVKFQTWITEDIVTMDSASADYQVENTEQDSQFKLLKELELPHEAFTGLKEFAREVGIQFLSTPDDPGSARFLVELGMPLLKTGSGELTNLPFLAELADYGLPMIVSTGMSHMEEVRTAVSLIRERNQERLTLLHCVSNYPADPAECNLRAMDSMRQEFAEDGVEVGYSDHTLGIAVPIAAVARGATVIEKHLTLDKRMPGPDHLCSADPSEFSEMVKAIREVEVALGDGVKRPMPSELKTLEVVRKEIVAGRNLEAGHRLEAGDLALKRGGGTGLPPADLPSLEGCILSQPLVKDQAVTASHLKDA